ncbi:MAG: hypothetical protein IKF01_00510 [Bacilli bacterium]|nr:hypothetical protein [Bacilli bacterium]
MKTYSIAVDEIIKVLEEKGEVINALNDRVFKSLFTDDNMRGILSYIISYVTEIDKDYIYENMYVTDSYETVHNIKEKENTHDLKVEVGSNVITLEMNQFNDRETRFRNSAHFHESIVKKLERAKTKEDIGRVIQISFDVKIGYLSDLISSIMMMDLKRHIIDSSEENFIKYKINLSKLRKIDYNVSKLSRFERILLIMMESKKSKLKSLAKGDKELEFMVKKIEDMSKDPNMVRYIKDENLRRIAYEMDMEESNKKGHESGYSEGERDNQRKIVKRMLDKNVDIKDIALYTGLSEKEILKM